MQLATERGAEVTREIPDHPCTVTADEDRLIQVLVNLFSNAVKFTPALEGRIKVQLREGDEAYRVSVVDNGAGIDAADQPKIFEKFQQAGGGTDKPIGTGLGLPISRKIIEHLGGRIWVESELGKGATFTFELPKTRAADELVED